VSGEVRFGGLDLLRLDLEHVGGRGGHRPLRGDAVDAQGLAVGDHLFAGDPDVAHRSGTCGPDQIGEQVFVSGTSSPVAKCGPSTPT
jgi:hypothetical protein